MTFQNYAAIFADIGCSSNRHRTGLGLRHHFVHGGGEQDVGVDNHRASFQRDHMEVNDGSFDQSQRR